MKINKHVFFFLLLSLIAANSFAQWGSKNIKGNENVIEETRNLSGYTEIDISGGFEVELVQGTPGKISIVAESNLLEHILTEVKKEKLTIEVTRKINLKPTQKIKIIIPFKELEKIELAGSGSLTSKKKIEGKKLSIKQTGSGNMDLLVNISRSISIFKSGSGNLQMNGKAKDISLKSTGSGKFNGEGLTVKKADLTLTGSGDAKIKCEDAIKAKVTGSGNVIYSGKPSKVNTKVTGSGKIKNE